MSERIAVITGGTGYLGREIVNIFSASGYKVYLPVRSLNKFREITDKETNESKTFTLKKIFAFECDVLDEKSVKSFLQKVHTLEKNRIDVLINTVGGFPNETLTGDMSESEFDYWFDLNFKSAFLFSSGVLNSMLNNKYGRIISIGSIAGLETMNGRLGYSVAKSALMKLMDTISSEYKDSNIFAATVVPSVIDTPSNREWGTEEEIRKWVTPEEIAGVILRFVSEEFRSVRQPVIKIYGNY
ncbi:MAG: SDR family NAD(P)-dependent oxidoreductase [Ignavibacteria bacterium]|jgi:NAD(P)-dependent dehydrogenase (short-subunit alcohol dehydrogenase family)|nr:SDR family NAD(P)-dependent oxidoreductase [Ignavibacteria bacterium]